MNGHVEIEVKTKIKNLEKEIAGIEKQYNAVKHTDPDNALILKTQLDNKRQLLKTLKASLK